MIASRTTSKGEIVLTLQGTTEIHRDPDAVFRELHDPEMLLACVPGAKLTNRVGTHAFEARMGFGVGPFKLAYSGFGSIVESDPIARKATMLITSRNAGAAPLVKMRATVAVDGKAAGCEVRMTFRVSVVDHDGVINRAWLDPIVRDVLDRSIEGIRQHLEEPAETPPAA